MNPYGGTLERKLRVISIRQSAENQVGECNDYQIMFCAAATGKIHESKVSLEDLSDEDLSNLYDWVVVSERVSMWA